MPLSTPVTGADAYDYSRGTDTAYADAPAIPAWPGGTAAWGTPPA
ncbi:hypothetical protein [Streptomyces griseosporeus]